MSNHSTSIIYNSVCIKNDEIAELDEKYTDKVVVAVPRDRCKKLLLKFGYASERPVVEILIGITLLAGGIYIALPLLENLINSSISNTAYISPQSSKFVALSFLYFPLAAYFFYLPFQKSYYVLVITENGCRKLVFKGVVRQNLLDQFITNTRMTFGWEISKDPTVEEALKKDNEHPTSLLSRPG